jgi:hypothetical protein
MWNGRAPDGTELGLHSGFIEDARIFDTSFDDLIDFPLSRPRYSPNDLDLYHIFSRLLEKYKGTIKKFIGASPDHAEFFKTYFLTNYMRSKDSQDPAQHDILPFDKRLALRKKELELKAMFNDYYPAGVAWGPGGVGHWYLFCMLHGLNVLIEPEVN